MKKLVWIVVFAVTVLFYPPISESAASEVEKLKQQNRELAKKVEKLSRAVEKLIKMVGERKKTVDTKLSRLAAPAKAAVPSKMARSGKKNVQLTISGQINRAGLYVDDGTESELFHVDNDNSSTRVRFVAKSKLDKNWSAGGLFEVQFESNSSASVEIDQGGAVGTNSFTERHLTLFVDHKAFGRFWLGQGDTASNGTSQADLSGTGVINYSGIQDMAGGISFRDSVTKAKVATIKSVYTDFDGLSRQDRFRYDTPKYKGFQFSYSHVQGDAWDVALRYGANYPAIGTKVKAAIAFADGGSLFNYDQFNGSISLLHKTGLSFTFAAGKRELLKRRGDEPFFYYMKAGFQRKFFSLGKTYISVDRGQMDDLLLVNDEFKTIGIAVVQKIDKLALELYISYRFHEFDRRNARFEDINTVMSGIRLKF